MLDVAQCPPLLLESELLMPFEVAEEFQIINMKSVISHCLGLLRIVGLLDLSISSNRYEKY